MFLLRLDIYHPINTKWPIFKGYVGYVSFREGTCFCLRPENRGSVFAFFLGRYEVLRNRLPRYILDTCPNL